MCFLFIKVLSSRIQSHGLISAMTYLPQSDSELVTLACWASNAVGRQTTPCLIHILPASRLHLILKFTKEKYNFKL
jgi:hypothetical protein